jgi:hypothetical protein
VLVAAAAALVLYLVLERAGRGAIPLAVLRTAAWGAVAVLLINPSCHRELAARTQVLIDGSLSMTDPASDARWRAAADTARAAAGSAGRIVVFGDLPSTFTPATRPDARTSRLLPALRDAASRGGRIVVVTDGEVDDAPSLPADLLGAARIVVLPRPPVPDVGISGLDLPAALRAGDTAVAHVELVAAGTSPNDAVTLELREQGHVVARVRVSLGAGGNIARDLGFVPAPASGVPETRRYEARLTGFARDAEPRDDARQTAASVSRASAISLFSDVPDWDFRWLVRTLTSGSGVPVHAFVHLGNGGWRDARSMHAVSDAAIRAEASGAALVVAHGSSEGVASVSRMAKRSLWQWITIGGPSDNAAAGDWYVIAPEFASPVGAALSGVPAESLPPLESVLELKGDTVTWAGMIAQLDRRGHSRVVVQGVEAGGRRTVAIGASGLWRWASHGGVAGEGYRALMSSLTDWLLQEHASAPASLARLRDSLGAGEDEFLPRTPTLHSQPGLATASFFEPEPVRFSPWLYAVALAALVIEWVARRRRGLR